MKYHTTIIWKVTILFSSFLSRTQILPYRISMRNWFFSNSPECWVLLLLEEKKVKVFTCQFNFHEAWWSDRKVPEKFLFRVLKERDACNFIPQWAKAWKKVYFGWTMYWLPQRLKWTFFEKKIWVGGPRRRPRVKKKFQKKHWL